MEETSRPMQLSPQEAKLLQLIRSVEYGELHIIVKDNKPIRAERVVKSIKLED